MRFDSQTAGSWAGMTLGDVSSSGDVTTGWLIVQHPCATEHVVRLMKVRSNQHQRTEYGECRDCGARFRRVIRWNERRVAWWEPIGEDGR